MKSEKEKQKRAGMMMKRQYNTVGMVSTNESSRLLVFLEKTMKRKYHIGKFFRTEKKPELTGE